jgi:hypothetical protein
MISIKINEARTIPVSRYLVDQLSGLYKKAFLKLVEVYIIDEISSADRAGKKFLQELLVELYKKYPEAKSSSIPIDKNFLYDLLAKMNRPNKFDRHKQISEIPVDTLLQIIKNDPADPLKQFLRAKMDTRTAVNRIKKYFQEKEIDSLSISVELQKTAQANNYNTTAEPGDEVETYAGLYFAESGTVSITFEAGFFTGTIITDDSGQRNRISPRLGAAAGKRPETIIDYLEDELRELSVSVRHELQHFYQSLFSKVFGVADFRAGLPPRQVIKRHLSGDTLDPHFSDPVEMQTDIQDEVDKFATGLDSLMNQHGDTLADQPELVKNIKRVMVKVFVDSKLEANERDIEKSYKLYRYVEPSKLFRDIKSVDKSGELYRYALRVLNNSVADIFTEGLKTNNMTKNNKAKNNIAKNNKVKVILTESSTITENITKDEIRKIVRDELEKLLHNKENKKEIADITKKMLKKLYRELSFNSTHIIDQLDV